MNEFTQTFVKRIKIVFATSQFVKNCLKVGFIFCFSFGDINSCFMKEKWSRSLSKGLNNLVFDLSWNVVTFSYWLFFTTADILMDSFCFSIKLYSLQGEQTKKGQIEKLLSSNSVKGLRRGKFLSNNLNVANNLTKCQCFVWGPCILNDLTSEDRQLDYKCKYTPQIYKALKFCR